MTTTNVYYKKNLTIKDGYAWVDENTIIGLPYNIINKFDSIDKHLQIARYMSDKTIIEDVNPLDDFEFENTIDDGIDKYFIEPDTPLHDKKMVEAIEWLNECEENDKVIDFNHAIEQYKDLIQWCDRDYIIDEYKYLHMEQFDFPAIGDIFKLTGSDIVDFIKEINECDIDMKYVKSLFKDM